MLLSFHLKKNPILNKTAERKIQSHFVLGSCKYAVEISLVKLCESQPKKNWLVSRTTNIENVFKNQNEVESYISHSNSSQPQHINVDMSATHYVHISRLRLIKEPHSM